jgi:hypothetical protein
MWRYLLPSLVLVLAGCTSTSARFPGTEALVVAFADDFHSGVLLERTAFPPEMVPAGAPTQTDAPWIVVHFGERRWIIGEADGYADALRLGMFKGEGGVQLDVVGDWMHRRGGTNPDRIRLWTFPLSAAGHAALLADLRGWIDQRLPVRSLAPGVAWHVSLYPWALSRNCHDFTISLLMAGGVPVENRPIMQASSMRQALDRAWQEHDEVLGEMGRR